MCVAGTDVCAPVVGVIPSSSSVGNHLNAVCLQKERSLCRVCISEQGCGKLNILLADLQCSIFVALVEERRRTGKRGFVTCRCECF